MRYRSSLQVRALSAIAALQAIVALLLTLAGQMKWPDWCKWVLFVAIMAIILYKYNLETIASRRLRIANIEYVLSECVRAIEAYQRRSGANTLRANVMVLKNNSLRIVASSRMEDCADKDIVFAKGQGCCGEAFESGDPIVGNLESVYRDSWEETRKELGRVPWGIDKAQFEKTRSLKSVFSLPLMAEGDRFPRAVLNFDDRVGLTTSHFGEREMMSLIQGHALHIYCEVGEGGL